MRTRSIGEFGEEGGGVGMGCLISVRRFPFPSRYLWRWASVRICWMDSAVRGARTGMDEETGVCFLEDLDLDLSEGTVSMLVMEGGGG